MPPQPEAVPRVDFDAYRDSYADVINAHIAFGGKSQDFYTRAKARHLKRLLRERLDVAVPAVLDIGCGHGLIHPYLADAPCRLTGIDRAAGVIEEARAANPGVDYQAYDGRTLPYPNDSFDAAYAICVMHHVPPAQWPEFMAEMRRVVRPGGIVMVFEHNKLNPLVQLVVSRIPIDRDAVLMTHWRALRLMREASLLDRRAEHILFLPTEAAPAALLEDRLSWLPMGAQYVASGRVP